MLKIKNINKINKNIFYIVILLLFSKSTFAQENQSGWDSPAVQYYNPEGAPSGDDPVALPIDEHIWILLILGLSLGIYKMNLQNK